MPVTIKSSVLQYKDGNDNYVGVDTIAERTVAEQIDDIEAAGTGTIAQVQQAVADSQAAVNTLEAEKNSIAQTVASMAQLGTDTSLSTPGMAADAATVGKLKSTLKNQEGGEKCGRLGLDSVIVYHRLRLLTYMFLQHE